MEENEGILPLVYKTVGQGRLCERWNSKYEGKAGNSLIMKEGSFIMAHNMINKARGNSQLILLCTVLLTFIIGCSRLIFFI